MAFLRRVPIITGVDLSKINLRKRRQTNETVPIAPVIEDEFNDEFFSSLDDDGPKQETKLGAGGIFKSEDNLFTGIYCGIINSFPVNCYQQNLLELWNFNRDVIRNLTVEDILQTINTKDTSLTTGHKMNVTSLLGDIKRNEMGEIIGAGSLITQWFVHVNFSEVDQEKHGNIAGTENWVGESLVLQVKIFVIKYLFSYPSPGHGEDFELGGEIFVRNAGADPELDHQIHKDLLLC